MTSDLHSELLQEQSDTAVRLSPEDAGFLSEKMGFDVQEVASVQGEDTAGNTSTYVVNPKYFVGHFQLPSGAVLRIRPKIPVASIFRMLGYVYASWRSQIFEKESVFYEEDRLLFEPLVELFLKLLSDRICRGLVQDYVEHDDNLRVLRGRVDIGRHITANCARPDRLQCRYHERTIDIVDNQILKWTLYVLTRSASWSPSTTESLRRAGRVFVDVTLLPFTGARIEGRTYSRLNDDYRLLHDLCRLFLEQMSFNEAAGQFEFRGFVLDMNKLFERFVMEAFSRAADRGRFVAHTQEPNYLSKAPHRSITMYPDVVVRRHRVPVCIADAKYKLPSSAAENADLYQMLAYGTVLQCNTAFLIYPRSTELDIRSVKVESSSVVIHVRGIDIAGENCISLAEQCAAQAYAEALSDNPA